ncbi:hypothetical protein [Nannocystis pusilla]|uniref:hypothetical protein n=1 Tax=Nannocystis pusilla TaxID=889268 RepID=UPI003B7D7176
MPADQARAARYFRARALLAAGTGAKATGEAGEEQTPDRGEAERLLRQLVAEDPLGYYGLQARQRLLDVGADPGPVPALAPVPAEANPPPDFAATRATFEALAGEFGWAFPALARGARSTPPVCSTRRAASCGSQSTPTRASTGSIAAAGSRATKIWWWG